MGVRNGTVIYRITNPSAPVFVAYIPGLASTWHEMTTCGEYLYSVADGVNQGLQIIDLRQIDANIVTLATTWHGPNTLNRVHTVQANFGSGGRSRSNSLRTQRIGLPRFPRRAACAGERLGSGARRGWQATRAARAAAAVR